MAQGKLSNYIPLSRKFFEHPFWKEKRKLSKAEAWLYLIQAARYEPGETKTIVGGKTITYGRGELVASVRFLAKAFDWGLGNTTDFLKRLETDEMIVRRIESGQTVISILNYDYYNNPNTFPNTEKPINKGTQRNGRTPFRTVSVQQSEHHSEHRSEQQNPIGTMDSEESPNTIPNTVPNTNPNKKNTTNNNSSIKEEEKNSITPKQQQSFDNFNTWLSEHAPSVLKMEQPFTVREYVKMFIEYKQHHAIIFDVLTNMHNTKKLTTKYKSAYLTCRNWVNRRTESLKPKTIATPIAEAKPSDDYAIQRAKEEARTLELAKRRTEHVGGQGTATLNGCGESHVGHLPNHT